MAPVVIIVAGRAIRPGQVAGGAHLVGMIVFVAEEPAAVRLEGAVRAAIAMDQLALLIQRVDLAGQLRVQVGHVGGGRVLQAGFIGFLEELGDIVLRALGPRVGVHVVAHDAGHDVQLVATFRVVLLATVVVVVRHV